MKVDSKVEIDTFDTLEEIHFWCKEYYADQYFHLTCPGYGDLSRFLEEIDLCLVTEEDKKLHLYPVDNKPTQKQTLSQPVKFAIWLAVTFFGAIGIFMAMGFWIEQRDALLIILFLWLSLGISKVIRYTPDHRSWEIK